MNTYDWLNKGIFRNMKMENIIDIYKLLPDEIENAILKLQGALEIVTQRKNTNSKLIHREKKIVICSKCNSNNIVKNGHTRTGVQTYKCKDCNHRFNDASNTMLANSKLNYKQIATYFECMDNHLSIRKTAKKMEVSATTVFLLRHKTLSALSIFREQKCLNGKVEADELYESINLKGTKTEKMPRFSKPRSSNGGSKRGISNHQVCIASAIDEYDNCLMQVVGTGQITSEQVKKVFNDNMSNCSLLITDCKSSYEEFVKENAIQLEQVKSGTYVNNNGYNLAEINSLHSEFETFMAPFKGVSTKHLQGYCDWFCFRKFINYTVEILKHVSYLMNESIIKSTSIFRTNVYSPECVIDFNQVYAEYTHHASC